MKTSITRAYVLDDQGDPVVEPNISNWIDWMNAARAAKRLMVGCDRVRNFVISTIFTGMSSEDPPEVWETVVLYKTEYDDLSDRYVYRFTWPGRYENAKANHDGIVKKITETLK